VFKSETYGNVEYRYESDPEVEKGTYPGYPGSLTLSIPSGKEPTPKNLTGSFRLMDLKGSFTGLEAQSDGDGGQVVNAWDIDKVDWASGFSTEATYGIDEGHTLEVYEVRDDDGHNFVAFIWDQGYSGCVPHYATCVAKKQRDENALVGLTDSERERLGMYLTEAEIVERADVKDSEEKGDVDERKAGKDSAIGGKRKVDDGERDVKRKRGL